MSNMTELPLRNRKIVEAVRSKFGTDENAVQEAVKILRDWLRMQPHLPHNMDDRRLEGTYLRCKTSIERTKKALDMYYTLRTAIPEILQNRDPREPWFKQTVNAGYVMALPQLTEGHYCVVLSKVLDRDGAGSVHVTSIVKLLTVFLDVLLMEEYFSSAIVVLDNKDVSLALAAKFTPPVVKKLLLCMNKGFVCRIKEIHVLNVPGYAMAVYNLVRSMLNPKFAHRVYIHKPGYDTLHNYVPRKVLPMEYGGEAGSDVSLWDQWKQKLESYRNWFLEEDQHRADESKRPGKCIMSSELFGFEGSFRQLSMD